jgi:hypothetical protein
VTIKNADISIIKILCSLNTTICLDLVKRIKQLHVSARGHLQVVSCGFARKLISATPSDFKTHSIQPEDGHVPKHVVVLSF